MSEEQGPLTLIFLLSQPRHLTVEQIRGAILNAWGVEVGDVMKEEGNWVVDGAVVNPAGATEGAQNFLADVNGHRFLINTVERPYVDDPQQVAESFVDERLKQAFGMHQAWLSVDHFGEAPAEEEKPAVYSLLGQLLAEFANEDCLAIYCLELDRCNEYTPAMIDALRSGPVLSLFVEPTNPPVVHIPNDDPRMVAAVEEMRRRWPEFVEAFRANQDPETPFAAKALFVDDDNGEFMWVTVQSIEDDVITGVLGNTPAFVKHVKEGDVVSVNFHDVNDWVYFKDGAQVGGLTMKVMEDAMNRPQ